MLELVLLTLSIFCAVVPMVLFLAFVWWMDRYDREPVWLVVLTFSWGAFGAVLLALIGNTIGYEIITMLGLSAADAQAATAAFVAPIVEEPMKALVLVLVARSRHFDNMTDGFVYGAAAGLGFGMTENFFYFAGSAMAGVGPWMMTVVVRTLFSAVMHAVATSIVGAAFGWARFRGGLTTLVAVPIGLAIAVGIHALWNGLLTLEDTLQAGGALVATDFLIFPVEFLVVFIVFQVCVMNERNLLRRELQEEADQGLLPAEHVAILSSFLRRGSSTWLDRRVPKGAYVRSATTLAFRKHQSERASGGERTFYLREVDRLRGEIEGLLARAQ